MAKTIVFPKKVLFGVGSSAYQVEGAWNAADKSPSNWDDYLHKEKFEEDVPEPPKLQSELKKKHQFPFFKGIPVEKCAQQKTQLTQLINGDTACDSYNKVDEDVNNLVELGVNFYRFSISWTRVLPNADSRVKNKEGIQYYHTLIDKLKKNNIKPLVTIFHWDLPASLMAIGGLSNPNVVGYFVDYANFLFEEYGNKVELWSTINEPKITSMGYGTFFPGTPTDINPRSPPSLGAYYSGISDYMAWRNLLLAHAAVYKAFKKSGIKGEISLALDACAFYPVEKDNNEHILACSKALDYMVGVFVQPLVTGEFPQSVLDSIEKTNSYENVKLQRLVPFSKEEKKDLIGSYDFIAFNYYSSSKLQPMTKEEYAKEKTLGVKDMGFFIQYDEGGRDLEMAVEGFTDVINYFKNTCGNPQLFITENGLGNEFDEYDPQKKKENNDMKIKYHHGILTKLYEAIQNGANIKGYSVWSFMDSLEWSSGYYESRYGIYSVDFQDPKRPRAKKLCFDFFQKLFKEKTLLPLENYRSLNY